MTIEEIKTSQKKHKISDSLLCETAYVALSTWLRYSKYNNGKSEPSYVKMQRIEIALNHLIEQKHALQHKK